MTRDDIIRMASEAGWHDDLLGVSFTVPLLERFANLIAAHEREACAKVCLEEAPSLDGQLCVEAIRARGEKP